MDQDAHAMDEDANARGGINKDGGVDGDGRQRTRKPALTPRKRLQGGGFKNDRRRECRSTCRTPTSSSTRPARDGWPAARKRARTPRVPQGKG